MIHYHGSPLSGPLDSASRFWRGRHAMVSFAHPDQLPLIALAKDARRAICDEFQRTWGYLQQKGYRVVKCVLTEASKGGGAR